MEERLVGLVQTFDIHARIDSFDTPSQAS